MSSRASKHGARGAEIEPIGHRTLRIQELIREEVNFLLRNEIGDPRLDGVLITMVELAPDGSSARLWYTQEDDAEKGPALDRAEGFLRGNLRESLGLRRTPELRFRRDRATRAFDRPDAPPLPTPRS